MLVQKKTYPPRTFQWTHLIDSEWERVFNWGFARSRIRRASNYLKDYVLKIIHLKFCKHFCNRISNISFCVLKIDLKFCDPCQDDRMLSIWQHWQHVLDVLMTMPLQAVPFFTSSVQLRNKGIFISFLFV